MTHSSVLFVAHANFAGLFLIVFVCCISSFEIKMSKEINRSMESDQSDLSDQLNYCDSTFSSDSVFVRKLSLHLLEKWLLT